MVDAVAAPTLKEIRSAFADDARASRLIAARRWGAKREAFRCPRCGEAGKPGAAPGHGIRCRSCRTVIHPLSGTVLDKAKVPASGVIWMTWTLATRPGGLSATEAGRETGISRVSCQRILGILRHALAEDESDRVLDGDVEADETFFGGHARDTNQRGRSPIKRCVLVLAERGRGAKCVLIYTPDASAKTLLPHVKAHVAPGATVITDGHKPYAQLAKMGFDHQAHVIRGSGVRAHVLLPAVHQVAGTVKDQIYGTHKRAPARELMQDYLGAFQWRYNRRDLLPTNAFLQALDVLVQPEVSP